ncbi:MAG: ATP-grasp domain-containing protein [Nitrospinae bacterium]|nr:ATP-grasp domain-containing protein [Nitrospinota bacterium]
MSNTITAPPVILIGSNVRFLAENAIRHGRDVFTVDFYGDWDAKKLSPNRSVKREGAGVFDLRALPAIADGIANSGVVYGPGFENDIFALARLSDLGLVMGCSIETVRKARDPETIARAATAWNFSYPKISKDMTEFPKGERWLIKPIASAGGVDIRLADEGLAPERGRVYYQQYVPGMPSSAMVVSNGSEAALLGVSTQIIGDPAFNAAGFRFVGNVFPHPFAREITPLATAIAEALTLEFEMKGLWGFDFIYAGSVTLIEINPRPTSALGPLDSATWNDLVGLHIDSVMGKKSNLILDPGPTGRYFAHGRIFARTECIFTGSQAWYDRGARDLPFDGDYISAGEPVMTLTAKGSSYNGALNKLRADADEALNGLLPATATPSLRL